MHLSHMHVHRGESNVIHDFLELVRTGSCIVYRQTMDAYLASIYCNGAVLAAWTHTRTLPFLSTPSRFSEPWRQKYDLLDRSFLYYIDGWEKPRRAAFLELIEASFSFKEDSTARPCV